MTNLEYMFIGKYAPAIRNILYTLAKAPIMWSLFLNFLTNYLEMRLDTNDITGSIPSEIGEMASLIGLLICKSLLANGIHYTHGG